jgi:hypothetical protein
VEQWVTDQGAGHDLGVMDSPPSLRINPYQLCETPLVLAVVATASQHGVSGRGSPVRRKLMRSARHWLDPTLLTA